MDRGPLNEIVVLSLCDDLGRVYRGMARVEVEMGPG